MKNILYIITPSRFLQYFTEFIIHKQQLGFTVNTYMVENIENGTFEDIKAFLDKESEKVQDDYYVILGGDGNLVPGKSILRKSIRFKDSEYACNDSGQYWRSVGRLPASDEQEIEDMCNCAINYETNFVSYLKSVLMIAATNNNIKESASIARKMHPIIQDINEQYTTTIGKFEILDSLRANIESFINYMGHGGSDKWTLRHKGKFLENILSDSIPLMEYKPVHILSWACSTANIAHQKCIGKTFLLNGAVSFWGAYSETYGKSNRMMARCFWDIYMKNTCPKHIGEIYLAIQKTYNNKTKGGPKYMLLGDPTLKIR